MGQTKRRILITGGAGFIGTHLTARLAGLGHEVRVLDLRAVREQRAGVECVQGDARDPGTVERLVDGSDVVYHLAATVSVPLCQKDPVESYSHNLTATLCVLDAVRKAAARGRAPAGLVFASSAAVYGHKGDDGHALREEDVATEFLSFYAAQKHASEKAIEVYAATFGIPATVFRFFNVFGPGQDPSSPYSGVIALFTRYAREGKPLPLNGGGRQTRDFISVHDVASACCRVLELERSRWSPRPLNLGTGRPVSVRELAETIKGIHGGRSPIVEAPPREADVLHSLADITRAREVLGFNPTRGLADGLKEL